VHRVFSRALRDYELGRHVPGRAIVRADGRGRPDSGRRRGRGRGLWWVCGCGGAPPTGPALVGSGGRMKLFPASQRDRYRMIGTCFLGPDPCPRAKLSSFYLWSRVQEVSTRNLKQHAAPSDMYQKRPGRSIICSYLSEIIVLSPFPVRIRAERSSMALSVHPTHCTRTPLTLDPARTGTGSCGMMEMDP